MDVLIVDDEPSILTWLSATVKPLGLNPVVADSGERALAILNEREVGFVITDFMMPGMDGAELVREIRHQHSVLPIVVMSGVGSVDDAGPGRGSCPAGATITSSVPSLWMTFLTTCFLKTGAKLASGQQRHMRKGE